MIVFHSLQLLVLYNNTNSYWIACLLLPSMWVIFHTAFGLKEYCHTSGSNNSRYSMKECAIMVYIYIYMIINYNFHMTNTQITTYISHILLSSIKILHMHVWMATYQFRGKIVPPTTSLATLGTDKVPVFPHKWYDLLHLYIAKCQ